MAIPAAEAATDTVAPRVIGEHDDFAALAEFVRGLDVVTYEFENVPVETARWLADRVPVYPIGYLPIVAFVAVAAFTFRRYDIVAISPSLAARETPGGLLLDGVIPWVTGASQADHTVIGATLGLSAFAGVVGVALLNSRFQTSVAYALPFSAGVTLYVASSDLIPEVNRLEGKNPMVSIVVFAGVALFYLLHRLIPR